MCKYRITEICAITESCINLPVGVSVVCASVLAFVSSFSSSAVLSALKNILALLRE